MTWQEPIALFIVGVAVAYLIWKLFFAGRTTKEPKKRGPDVEVGRLTRKSKDR